MRYCLTIFICFLSLFALDKSATIDNPHLLQEKYKEWGAISALPLLKYYKTNHIAELKDGSYKQYIGIRFLASDLDAIKDRVAKIYVVDFKTEDIIDVEDAFYVVNSKAKGIHSRWSKIAFKNKEDAEEFIKKYGGDIRNFEFALFLAKHDLKEDEEFFAKENRRFLKMGEKLYKLKCQDVDPLEFESILTLKSALKEGLCEKLNKDKLQSVVEYLWLIKRVENSSEITNKIAVPEDAKCPVCGMFVAKYPKWVASIEHNEHTHYFDGAKDAFKYYFDPEGYGGHKLDSSAKMMVSNYYTLEPVDAKEAFFVIGSDVYGPMGHELIPFKTKEEAEEFRADHFGKKILKFEEIDEELPSKLDSGVFE